VGVVLAKGAISQAGKWNNHDLKIMIQWFKRNGDKAMPKNKEGLLLCYRKTHTRVVQETYPDEDVAATVAASVSASASCYVTSQASQPNCKTFSAAAAGFQADTYVAPTFVTIATNVDDVTIAVDSDLAGVVIVIDPALVRGAPTSDLQPNTPSNASPLDWVEEAPFDVGVQLTMNAPLCGIESEYGVSDDDSIFVDLLRD
jgi:hypothetical protein